MKNELQTMRLFSPLFPHIYRKNEWDILAITGKIYPPVRFWNTRTKSSPSFKKKAAQ